MPAEDPVATAVWTDAARADMALRLIEAMGDRIEPQLLGGQQSGELHDLAVRLNVPSLQDDGRAFCMASEIDCLLLTTTEGIDTAAVDQAVANGVSVLTLEPLDNDVESAAARSRQRSGHTNPTTARLLHAGLIRRCPGWINAADPLDVIEQLQAIRLLSQCPASQRSLWAQLYDVWDAVLEVSEPPESIEAGHVTASQRRQNNRHISGHIAVIARFLDGRLAVMHVTDADAPVSRRLDLFGKGGHVTVDDNRYELYDPSGAELDRGELPQPTDLLQQICDQWQALLRRDPAALTQDAPHREARVLACCQTTLLSCRTGAAERPELLLKMATPE